MNTKSKIIVASSVIIGLITIGFFVFSNNSANTMNSVKIVEYRFSICTQNIPSSSCGPYDVTVQDSSGKKSIYKVPGFQENETDRNQYQQISSKIETAKQRNSSVVLTVNANNEIVAVQ